MKASVQVGDIVVTLSLAERTALPIPKESESEIQAFLDDIVSKIAAQMNMGFEGEVDKAILRAIKSKRR